MFNKVLLPSIFFKILFCLSKIIPNMHKIQYKKKCYAFPFLIILYWNDGQSKTPPGSNKTEYTNLVMLWESLQDKYVRNIQRPRLRWPRLVARAEGVDTDQNSTSRKVRTTNYEWRYVSAQLSVSNSTSQIVLFLFQISNSKLNSNIYTYFQLQQTTFKPAWLFLTSCAVFYITRDRFYMPKLVYNTVRNLFTFGARFVCKVISSG